MADCPCFLCTQARHRSDPPEQRLFGLATFSPLAMARMFVCETCGNKRCPHATDHRFSCTGSNEPGQVGSRYHDGWRDPDREAVVPRDAQAADAEPGMNEQ